MKKIAKWFYEEFLKSFIEEFLKSSEKKITNQVNSLKQEVDALNAKLTPGKVQEINDPTLHTKEEYKIRVGKVASYNKDERTFHLSHPLYRDASADEFRFHFPNLRVVKQISISDYHHQEVEVEVSDEVLEAAKAIYATNLCTDVRLTPFRIEFTKSGACTWEEVLPKVLEALFKHIIDFNEPKMSQQEEVGELASEK